MKPSILFLSLLILGSCHNQPPTMPPAAPPTATSLKNSLKNLPFDYKRDLACGMPLTAGLEDTVHYKGKLYGFCSKECKDAFLTNPAAYLAEIKK